MKEGQKKFSKSRAQNQDEKRSQVMKGFIISSFIKCKQKNNSTKQREKWFKIGSKKKKDFPLKKSSKKKSKNLVDYSISSEINEENLSFKNMKILNKGRIGKKLNIASLLNHHNSRDLNESLPLKLKYMKKNKKKLKISGKIKTTSTPLMMNREMRTRVKVSKTPPPQLKNVKIDCHFFEESGSKELSDSNDCFNEGFTLDQYCDMMDKKSIV